MAEPSRLVSAAERPCRIGHCKRLAWKTSAKGYRHEQR
ncbi:hypothetical protein F442_22388 [Phytophthora nicotianae P10297]|uniref:Uncharacterized protein n=4 Tax=Phytophthora nicotianae TaxID=4792 RepID=W2PH41_PHYN3|nr:hypothetical protein PPTG_24284 [Phytophthora nicotianae INRA-310]ETL26803.1 hypothetical protein L916_19582 [Phytophthora nicotianae]ETO61739.1 hypothetical protein F444_20265 [Phytophthora nicotianae P1976]ETP28318.1 hypothetical protein F442_22388 [Phytophthora nicotianae P10297]ETM33282.1 hypothetical protein L914_19469 [Phytophthora nicotianae]ETN00328.1 hypothetical protein PPTG_24284 [Phytophthora nicotianae INRA-310]